MIRYLYADQLNAYPKLRETMLRDRAEQFHARLKWEVSVDDAGFECDTYDDLNPLYVIWENRDGSHGGSMRFLPTTGPTMVNDHFAHLVGGGALVAPRLWETTRFCVSPRTSEMSRVAALLMLAGAELGTGFGLSHAIGVFDARMVRIYRRLGWSPEILGSEGQGKDAISAGLWEFTEGMPRRLARQARIDPRLSRMWFQRAFGTGTPQSAEAA